MGSPKSTREKLPTFNERVALRWFLYTYRLCRPEVLTGLAQATCEPEPEKRPWAERMGHAPPWLRVSEPWFSEWVADFGLPDTSAMREIADATVTIGSGGLEEPRWGFEELPPEGPPEWEKVRGLRAPEPPDAPPFAATLPGRPPFVEETDRAYRLWKRTAVRLLEKHAREAAEKWERAIREFLSWEPEELWFLAPAGANPLRENYPAHKAVRDLTWLAIKQATGAGYRSIPGRFADLLDELIPRLFLQPQKRKTVEAAIQRAAGLIGVEGRIRAGTSGRPGNRATAP